MYGHGAGTGWSNTHTYIPFLKSSPYPSGFKNPYPTRTHRELRVLQILLGYIYIIKDNNYWANQLSFEWGVWNILDLFFNSNPAS